MKTLMTVALALSLTLACGKKDKEAGDKNDPAADKTAATDKTPDTDKKPDADKKPEDMERVMTSAEAELKPTKDSKVAGKVTLTEKPDGTIDVVAEVTGLSPGDHGFHIHETGDCSSPDGKSAGGHFNPKKVDHGAPKSDTHHAGDLGNLTADDKGVAKATMNINFVTLDATDATAIGKAFIVHEKADDLKTQPTGAAGARLACGVIVKK